MRNKIDNLRKITEATIRYFYSYLAFRECLKTEDDVKIVNKNPEFWLLFESSMLANVFIGIRRIYENQHDSVNLEKFIKSCFENITDFSSQALKSRKLRGSSNASDWIDEYMRNVYEPSVDDFKKLKRLVRKNSKNMKGIYSKVATKVYAHAIHFNHAEVLLEGQNLDIYEIEKALLSVWHCYEQIWELYENGREPLYEIGEYGYRQEVFDAVKKQIKNA